MIRKNWNIEEFDQINLPEVIGQVNESFAKFNPSNPTRVLDMPIFMPDQGWKVPASLSQFKEVIDLAVESERRFGDFERDHFVYVTIDQKIVQAGNTGRRAGAHSDAFIEQKGIQLDVTEKTSVLVSEEVGPVSHTYVVHSNTPTEFFNAKFKLRDCSCAGSLRTFDEIADQSEIIQYPNFTLLRLDPFVVHRSGIAKITKPRTFMKVSFSTKKYARIGNTVNRDFEYDWLMTPRGETRNHPWV